MLGSVEQLEVQEPGDTLTIAPQISLHVMSGVLLPQTLKFKRCIGTMELCILVDGGSTHNFIQAGIISLLKLPINSYRKFEVIVGNGNTLTCEGVCAVVPIKIQNKVFLVDCYILPIQGAEVVLGVQWL